MTSTPRGSAGRRLDDARDLRAQARRRRAARKRRAADAGLCRRAGRRLGLEPRDRRRRVLAALEADARLRRRRDRTARQRVGTAAAPRRHAAGAGSQRERRARRARVRGRVPAPPQGRPLRPGPLARLSGPARARRAGRAHRRHPLRPHRTPAGGSRAGADGAPLPPRLRAGRRAAAHRARDARPVRRAADGAEPRHRRAEGRVRRLAGHRRRSSRRSRRSRGRSIATSTSSSGSSARPRSTTSACARRSPTTSRTGRGASTSRPSSTRPGLLDDRLASEAETTLYRIAQEALTNVAKHSRATRVDVILERQADSVLLIVEDDGVGFDPDAERHRPAAVSGCSACRSGRRSSARRSRSNRPPARARRSFCGWRRARDRRSHHATMADQPTPLPHPARRRPRDGPARAEACSSTASPT